MTKAKTEKATRILLTTDMDLPCHLTREEVEAYSEKLVTALEDLTDAEQNRKAITTSLKAREEELSAVVTSLRVKIRLRREDRKVTCEDRLNGTVVERVRTDTGSVVAQRHATESELQGHLFEGSEK